MAVYPTTRNSQDLCYFARIEKDGVRSHTTEDRMCSNNFAIVHLPELRIRKIQTEWKRWKRDEGSRGKWVKGMGSALWLWLSGRCGLPARSALAVIAIGVAVALRH